MGVGIAQVFATADLDVVIADAEPSTRRHLDWLRREADARPRTLSPRAFSRLDRPIGFTRTCAQPTAFPRRSPTRI
jgi:3-hydroxyacyl-CoA dehydrogenase